VTRPGRSLRNRQASYLLRDLLLQAGYVVVRCRDPRIPIDLVAWGSSARLLFLQVRNARRPDPTARDAMARFGRDIAAIRSLPLPLGAELQLWVIGND
jgi:hypothetical protein